LLISIKVVLFCKKILWVEHFDTQGSENSAFHKKSQSAPLSPTNNPRVSTARLKKTVGRNAESENQKQ
jgi:hypothetical protein